jgi:hypothetical protein
MTHSEYLETIHGGHGVCDFAYIEMERVLSKLNAVYNPKNKTPFWKRDIAHINPNWRNNCVSFDYEEEIVSIDLRDFSIKHGEAIDKEIEIILIEEFEKAIIKSEEKDEIVIEKDKHRYMWNPWEEELYDYIDKTCT